MVLYYNIIDDCPEYDSSSTVPITYSNWTTVVGVDSSIWRTHLIEVTTTTFMGRYHMGEIHFRTLSHRFQHFKLLSLDKGHWYELPEILATYYSQT